MILRRYWFYFLASSLIVLMAGVIVILVWRILVHCVGGCGGWAAAVRGGRRGTTYEDDQHGGQTAHLAARVKCKCEKLVSGQTLVGRIVVSARSYLFNRLSHNCYTLFTLM